MKLLATHENIGRYPIGDSWKYWRIPKTLANHENIGGYPKYWRLMKTLATHENIGGSWKYWRLMKIMADTQNIGGSWKYWRLMKTLAGIQNIGVWQKYRRAIESWRALKSPRLAKISAEKFGVRIIWARWNLQLLTSSWSGWRALVQILVDVLPLRHVDPKWDHSSSRSAFMGGVSPVLYRLVVPARHAKIYAGVQILGGRTYFHYFLWKL